ncbi:GtrA family protein [Streptomyces sp. SHP 1-2]|nr:GtrA family protein [Streptomyces sp. SHP 1-2]
MTPTEETGPLTKSRQLGAEAGRFGLVGGLGWFVDTLTFNFFLNVLGLASVRSGLLASAVATAFNYLGHRHWTYRQSVMVNRSREVGLFVLFSIIGMAIQNGVLAVSHYGFGYTSTWADNFAKNMIGLGIATVFRFWAYRSWVFRVTHHPRGLEE